MSRRKVLLIGYGNPSRRDDGLGPALAARVERLGIPDVAVEADYQLTVEDAVAVADAQVVIFADADAVGQEPFSFRPLAPVAALAGGISSHSVEPQEVLGLAEQIFGRKTEAYLMGIRGYNFEPFEEKLSKRAQSNLEAGLRFLEPILRQQSFRSTMQVKSEKSLCG
jgi:hydrogenase maturation protease